MITIGKEQAKHLLKKDGMIDAVVEVLDSCEFGTFITSCAEHDTAEDKELESRGKVKQHIADLRTITACKDVDATDVLYALEDAIFELECANNALGYERATRAANAYELEKRCCEEVTFHDPTSYVGSDVFDVVMFLSDKFALVDPFNI